MGKPLMRASAWLLALLVLCGLTPLTIASQSAEIRVGCVDIDNFLVISDDGFTTGYAAEYLEKIAEHTNWNYKYMRGTWAQCLEWLENGEIDLLLPAEHSEKRSEKFIFSREMCCMDYASLVGRSDDDTLYYDDFEAFNGMRVGKIEGNYLNELFDEYAAKNGFGVETVMYKSGEKVNEALANGEVDAIVSGNMNFFSNQKLLSKISFMPAYFMMNKKDKALMDELDEAQRIINLEDPYYTAWLHEKYYGKIERQTIGFTREEAEYCRDAGKVKVYIDKNRYPLEFWNKPAGEADGLYLRLVQKIFDECGLEAEPVPTELGVGEAQFQDGIVICAADEKRLQADYALTRTDDFFTASYSLVGLRGTSLELYSPLRVAVVSSDVERFNHLSDMYPNAQAILFGSVDECFYAVRRKNADVAFVDDFKCKIANSYGNAAELVALNANSIDVGICMGIGEQCSPILKTVLNKGIKKLGREQTNQYAFNYIMSQPAKITIYYLIEEYPAQVAAVVIFMIAAVAAIASFIIYIRISRKQNLVLQEKNRQLGEAVETQLRLQLECERDPLTGLKNKRAAAQLCEELLKSGNAPAHTLIILDIDDFKKVNDTYGHTAGDKALEAVAEQMRKVFNGQILGRIGGDEFLIMMRDEKPDSEIQFMIERFREGLNDSPHYIRCSIGAAHVRLEDKSFREIFDRADKMLYKAKSEGKNKLVMDDS